MDLNLTNVLLVLILSLLLIVHWETFVSKTSWLIGPMIKVLAWSFLIAFVGFIVWGALHFEGKPRGSTSDKAIWFLWFICSVAVAIPLLQAAFALLNGRSESFMSKQIDRYRQNREDGKNPWD